MVKFDSLGNVREKSSQSTMDKEDACFTCCSIKQAPTTSAGRIHQRSLGVRGTGEAAETSKDRNPKTGGEGSMMDGRTSSGCFPNDIERCLPKRIS